ncbi:MAG: response regulator [Candidatus Schekmanbacteria bacterium]|nr:MAG: response regulator [Candidatus Schekmanbacteria bacterium]
MDEKLIEKVEEKIGDILEPFNKDIDEIFKTFSEKPIKSLHKKSSTIEGKEFLTSEKNKKAVICTLNSDEEFKGTIYLSFSYEEVCTISGIVNGLAENDVEEKIKSGNYDENDIDTVSEIANQIASKLNSAFNPVSPKKVHFIKKAHFINEGNEESGNNILNENEKYLSNEFSISIEGNDLGVLFILIPLDTGAEILGLAEDDEESEKKKEKKVRKIIVLAEELDSESETTYSEAAKSIEAEILSCKCDSDISQKGELKEADIIFLDFENDPEKGISICKEVINSAGKGKKVILSSKNITKPILMKALSNGINDIIVKPTTTETVVKKVQMNMEQ